MAKRNKNGQNQVHVIWVIFSCLILYSAICYFNGPEYQHELAQESVRKFAGYIAGGWFFISIIILRKQGTRVVLFKKKKPAGSAKAAVPKTAPIPPKTAPNPPKAAPNPAPEDVMVVKDPATGAERLFHRDPQSGEWVSEDGNSVLDPDRLPDWNRQRADDRSWIDEENKKLKNRESWLDKKLKEEDRAFREAEAKLEEEHARKLKNLQKYGVYTNDADRIRQIIERNQRLEELNAKIQRHHGNVQAFAEDVFTVLSKVCDYGVDVLAEMTGPAGKYVVRNVYITGRNVGSRWSEAVNYEQDEWAAIKRASSDSVVDMVQASVGDKYKMLANVGGDAVKGGLDAYEKGESVVSGALSGGTTGFFRTRAGEAVDSAFGKITKSFQLGEIKKLDVLKGKLESGSISQNVYKGIRQVRMADAAQKVRLINQGGKTVVGDMVDDLTKWVLE